MLTRAHCLSSERSWQGKCALVVLMTWCSRVVQEDLGLDDFSGAALFCGSPHSHA